MQKGDVVQLTEEGRRRFKHMKAADGRKGTVACTPRPGSAFVQVLWDGGSRDHPLQIGMQWLQPAER